MCIAYVEAQLVGFFQVFLNSLWTLNPILPMTSIQTFSFPGSEKQKSPETCTVPRLLRYVLRDSNSRSSVRRRCLKLQAALYSPFLPYCIGCTYYPEVNFPLFSPGPFPSWVALWVKASFPLFLTETRLRCRSTLWCCDSSLKSHKCQHYSNSSKRFS